LNLFTLSVLFENGIRLILNVARNSPKTQRLLSTGVQLLNEFEVERVVPQQVVVFAIVVLVRLVRAVQGNLIVAEEEVECFDGGE